MNLLVSHHSQSKEVCEWVINTYANSVHMKNNDTVREWVIQSMKVLSRDY